MERKARDKRDYTGRKQQRLGLEEKVKTTTEEGAERGKQE